MVLPQSVVTCSLPDSEVHAAVAFAYHALTHTSATRSDRLENYIQVLVDELAERIVVQWLREQNKFAEPVGDKGATDPDLRNEIWVTDIRGVKVRAAVHTFLSTHKNEMSDILENHSLSVETRLLSGINFSVVYWYQLHQKPRIKLPSLRQVAIIGWASDKNFREKIQPNPSSKYAAIKFTELRPVEELLQFLV